MKENEGLLDKKNMNLKFKKISKKKSLHEKGITLIALVVTIVLLLILAGVTINFAIGNNGIITKAQKAKETYQRESLLEEMRLAMLDKKLEKGTELTNDDLEETLGKYGEVQKDEEGNITGVKPNGQDEVITYEEIEYGGTSTGEGSTGSAGPDSTVTNAELAALVSKVENLDSRVTEHESNTTAQIESLQAQIQTLQEGMSNSGETSQEVAAMQSELEGLKAKVESAENSTKTELDTVKGKITDLETKVTNGSLDRIYPVGSIYISTDLKTESEVKNKLGGTWVKYAAGRTLVGVETSGTSGTTGGNKTISLNVDNLPSHTHSIPQLNVSRWTGEHDHDFGGENGFYPNVGKSQGGITQETPLYMFPKLSFLGASMVTRTNSVSITVEGQKTDSGISGSVGGNKAINVQDPYITVYMYRRTA